MSDDFEDTPRSSRNKGSGDNTVKVLLIIFVGFFGLLFLVCCGSGAFLFYKGKRMVEQAAMTNPADIQKLTAEITDITIPPEFAPQHGSALPIVNMKMVHYVWCPAGNCGPVNNVPNIDSDNMLMLMSTNVGENDGAGVDYSKFDESMMTDDVLKQTWKEHTKTEHTFDIRGKSCKFYIVQGEELAAVQVETGDLESEEMPEQTEPAITPEAAVESTPGAEPGNSDVDENVSESAPVTSQPGTGRRIVQISGNFPGKSGASSLQIRLLAENYDEEMILEMLKSIR